MQQHKAGAAPAPRGEAATWSRARRRASAQVLPGPACDWNVVGATPAAAALVADTEAAPGPWEGGPWSGGAPFWELFYASGGVSVRPACRPPFPHRAWRGSGD